MELYVVRHGQSVHNEYLSKLSKNPEDITIEKPETTDTGLTEKGIEETKKAIDVLDDFCDYMYIAPLKRTLETAEIIKQAKFDSIPFEVDDLLKEVDYGEVEGLTSIESKLKFGKDYKEDVLDFSQYGGESYDSIKNRVQQFLDKVKNTQHERVIIVTSQGIIKMMYEILIGHIAPSVTKHIRVKNATVHLFRI